MINVSSFLGTYHCRDGFFYPKEEKDFYLMIGDYLLQKQQEEVIARNVY